MASFGTITVEEVKAKREAGEEFRLIDVREPSEYQICRIEGAELKPLGQIMQWMQDFARALDEFFSAAPGSDEGPPSLPQIRLQEAERCNLGRDAADAEGEGDSR